MNQTPEQMNEAMERLYDEATRLLLISKEYRQSQLAKLLNVPSQNVKNWETRGPSKDALLYCQREYGIDATFIETGKSFRQYAGKIGTAIAHGVIDGQFVAPASPDVSLQSPLVVAAVRLERSPAVDAKTKAAATQILQSLLKTNSS